MKHIIAFISIVFINVFAFAQTEIGTWAIINGKLKESTHPNFDKAKTYWNKTTELLPALLIDKYVTSFRLFTDGKDNELGGMSSLNNNNTKWEVDFDIIDMNLNSKNENHIKQYTHTIIHEFGHLLTLNSTQIQATEDLIEDPNKGYLTSEGYAIKTSYLNQFVSLFWLDKLTEWDNIDAIKNENRKVKKLYKFYLEHQSEFLTDYAAESPEEDIAESWTFFVLADKPNQHDLTKYKKVLFFYKFPELIKMRQHIRKSLTLNYKNYIEAYKLQYN